MYLFIYLYIYLLDLGSCCLYSRHEYVSCLIDNAFSPSNKREFSITFFNFRSNYFIIYIYTHENIINKLSQYIF